MGQILAFAGLVEGSWARFSGTCNFVSHGFEIASDTSRLVALDFNLSSVNGTSAPKIVRASRQLLNFLERKMRWEMADNNNGFSSASRLFPSQDDACLFPCDR